MKFFGALGVYLAVVVIVFSAGEIARAQTVNVPTASTLNIPNPPTGGSEPVQLTTHEKLSLASGKVSFSVPIISLQQRGGKQLNIGYVFNGGGYSLREVGAGFQTGDTSGIYPLTVGINLQKNSTAPWLSEIHPNLPTLHADLLYTGASIYCPSTGGCSIPGHEMIDNAEYCVQNWTFVDWEGGSHSFPGTRDCSTGPTYPTYQGYTFKEYYPLANNSVTGEADADFMYDSTDGDFYKINATNSKDIQIVAPDGTVYHFNGYSASYVDQFVQNHLTDLTRLNYYSAVFSSMVDPNGNTITVSGSVSSGLNLKDTMGRVVTVTNLSAGSADIKYYDSNGNSQTSSMRFKNVDTSVSFPYSFPGEDSSKTCQITPFPSGGVVPTSGGYMILATPVVSASASASEGQRTFTLSMVNGSSYEFQLDSADNLIRISYPTGGYTRYDYGYASYETGATFGDVYCTNIPATYLYAKHECTKSGGDCTQSSTYTTANTCKPSHANGGEMTTCYSGLSVNVIPSTTVSVIDPEGNLSTHTTVGGDTQPSGGKNGINETSGYEELEAQYYSGTSTLLRTVAKTYGTSDATCPGGFFNYSWAHPCSVTTTYNDASSSVSSVVNYQYDTAIPFHQLQEQESDFSGNKIRTTTTSWNQSGIYADTVSTSSQPVGHILNHPSLQTVTDNVNSLVHTTSYTYDFYGNLSTVTQTGTGTGTYTTTYTGSSNNYGAPTSVKDPLGNETKYAYDDSWYDQACAPTANKSNVYVTKVTAPDSETTSYSYYSCTGQLATVSDSNSQKSTFKYDSLGRVTSTLQPDGGGVSISYDDNPPMSIEISQDQCTSGSECTSPKVSSTTTFDGAGRKTLDHSPGGIYTGYGYDGNSRICAKSNPTTTELLTAGLSCTPADNTSLLVADTDGITYTTYDGMGRNLTVTYPDGNSASATYSGTTVTSTNENGSQWIRTSDASGNLVKVQEPNGNSHTASLTTQYSYDGFGNLLSAVQNGDSSSETPRTRTFTYDALSRLICASNPESASAACPTTYSANYTSGTVGYVYDADGNLAQKTDARGVVTTYSYDNMNRLLSKIYSNDSNHTPFSCYQYGSTSVPNGKGRLANSWTQSYSSASCASTLPSTNVLSSRSVLSYDVMGRVKLEQQCSTPGNCSTSTPYSLGYSYDLMGKQTAFTNSAGANGASLTFTNAYDSGAHLSTVSSNWTAYQGNAYQPTVSIYNLVNFGPAGPTDWLLGNSLSVTRGYTNRMWINSLAANGAAK